MYTSVDDLLSDLSDWMEKEIPEGRLENDYKGRPWFLRSIMYQGKLKLSELREVANTAILNLQFQSRYGVKSPTYRKGISALKAEISMLYSFKRSFVERYKGRLHYYCADLSQKGNRNMSAAGLSFGIFSEFRQNMDS
jgi:hypothetical protein